VLSCIITASYQQNFVSTKAVYRQMKYWSWFSV